MAQGAGAPEETLEPAPEATPLPAGLARFVEPYKGDLDGMIKRRVIRVLTVQNPVLYFVDRGREVGMTYEPIKAFEKQLNENLGQQGRDGLRGRHPRGARPAHPAGPGRGDIAAAQLTITPGRKKEVDFSDPVATGVNREVLVTGPATPPVARVDVLRGGRSTSGRRAATRSTSRPQRAVHSEGKPPVKIVPADETLETGDILEMVSAGLAPATVVDSFTADLYTQIFPNLRKNSDVASRPGDIAWAFRKNSPKLAEAVNGFLRTHRQGSLAGNVLINKYVKNTKWVKNARSDEDRKRFLSMLDLFRKYGDRYELDYLLMAAQGYQESGLDQSKRSHVGAIGVMQVMPTTARDKAVNIPDIEKLESNIHAGIKYNRWMMDNFFNEPGIHPRDRALFAFASYNAGPGGWRASARKRSPRASTQTSGSTTWSSSRRSASAARPSPTSATSTSTTWRTR